MSILAIPTTGFGRSVNVHNVQLDAMCDWIEGSVLFGGEKMSKRDFVDSLLESNIYDDQDFASERVDDAWMEIRSKQNILGGATPYQFKHQSIQLIDGCWEASSGHAFCVMLSLSKWYSEWSRSISKNYGIQGELFELLVFQSVKAHFPGWHLELTGWSGANAKKIEAVVDSVAACVGEPRTRDIYKWTPATKNEAGLDMVCARIFQDRRGGHPVYLFQCASGKNYEEKLHTPDLRLWTRLIEFSAKELPTKAFATPFAFLQEEFIQNCNLVGGLLMDRYRLLEAGSFQADWIPAELAKRLKKWVRFRVAKLPFLEA